MFLITVIGVFLDTMLEFPWVGLSLKFWEQMLKVIENGGQRGVSEYLVLQNVCSHSNNNNGFFNIFIIWV